MGLFDRFLGNEQPRGQTYDAQPKAASADEQALARYRYMLKTAPPETIEQAHTEAFAQLTPDQRRMVLEGLRAEMPEAERASAASASDAPGSLARMATRAEVRQPGTMERMFGGGTAGSGFGGMLAGGLLGSVAGTVLGTMIAQNFLGSHGMGDAAHNDAHDPGSQHAAQDATTDAGDNAAEADDDFASGDDFDMGDSFDV